MRARTLAAIVMFTDGVRSKVTFPGVGWPAFIWTCPVSGPATGPPKLMPHSFACRAISRACACSSNALVGMHPQMRQVPPSAFCFSTTAVFRPSWAARIAAT